MAEENIELILSGETYEKRINNILKALNPEKATQSFKDLRINNSLTDEKIERIIEQINYCKRGISDNIKEFAKHAGPEKQKAFASKMLNLKDRSIHNISIETEISENMGANNIDTLIAMGGVVKADHPKAHLYTPEAALKRAIKRINIDQINMLSNAGVKVEITSENVLDTFESCQSKEKTFQLVEKQLVPAISKLPKERADLLVTSVINNLDLEKKLRSGSISAINNMDAGESRQPEKALVLLINKLDKKELAKLSTVGQGKSQSAGDDMLDWAINNSKPELIKTLLERKVASKTPDKIFDLALKAHTNAATNYLEVKAEINSDAHFAVKGAREKENTASEFVHALMAERDIKKIANTETLDWAIKNRGIEIIERISEHDAKANTSLVRDAINKPWPFKATPENKVFFDKIKAVTPDIYKVNSLGKTAIDTNPDFFTTKERIVNFGLKIVGGLREAVNKSRNEEVKVNISKVAQRMQTEPHKQEQQQEKNLNRDPHIVKVVKQMKEGLVERSSQARVETTTGVSAPAKNRQKVASR